MTYLSLHIRAPFLAMTLAGLCSQEWQDFNVIIADQSDQPLSDTSESLQAVIRLLRLHGQQVDIKMNLPRQGLAQQRQFLLEQSTAKYCLFLDDDVILEPFVIGTMIQAIQEDACGFVGQALIGLSFIGDVRPEQQHVEFWETKVEPELVEPGSPKWQRYVLHVQQQLKLLPSRPCKYKVAWVGGCVLYDAEKLRKAGGFEFWKDLPPQHAGEDVLAQLRVMKRFGGCGLLPSGAYHQEVATTITNRDIDAPKVIQP